MNYPLDELLDKRSIIQLKIERIEDEEDKEMLKKEFKDYTKVVEEYISDGICSSDQFEKWHKSLYEINGIVWDLEADIRKGKDEELGMSEIGKRAIKIRDNNSIRIMIKAEIVRKSGIGYFDIKTNHISRSNP